MSVLILILYTVVYVALSIPKTISIVIHYLCIFSLLSKLGSIYIYIYNRFIVHFPIGLDFPLITLPFQEC